MSSARTCASMGRTGAEDDPAVLAMLLCIPFRPSAAEDDPRRRTELEGNAALSGGYRVKRGGLLLAPRCAADDDFQALANGADRNTAFRPKHFAVRLCRLALCRRTANPTAPDDHFPRYETSVSAGVGKA